MVTGRGYKRVVGGLEVTWALLGNEEKEVKGKRLEGDEKTAEANEVPEANKGSGEGEIEERWGEKQPRTASPWVERVKSEGARSVDGPAN